jgi:hypothetical protein
MSITLRIKPDNNEYPDMILVEPAVADNMISRLFAVSDESTVSVFCEILMIIHGGVKGAEPRHKITETIDLFLELAFLESKEYSLSFSHFLKRAGGELGPGEALDFSASDLTHESDQETTQKPGRERAREQGSEAGNE